MRDESPLRLELERLDGENLNARDKGPTRALEEFLPNSGDEPAPIKRGEGTRACAAQPSGGSSSGSVWDSHSADACPIEMVQTANGQLSAYYDLDFETVRPTIEVPPSR